jgi:hypothetical protein
LPGRAVRRTHWKVDELIALLDAAERVPVKRGAYRKTREAGGRAARGDFKLSHYLTSR